MAIVLILSVLAGMATCALIFNPGKYGITPAGTEAPPPD